MKSTAGGGRDTKGFELASSLGGFGGMKVHAMNLYLRRKLTMGCD